jgi:hypothetical protein
MHPAGQVPVAAAHEAALTGLRCGVDEPSDIDDPLVMEVPSDIDEPPDIDELEEPPDPALGAPEEPPAPAFDPPDALPGFELPSDIDWPSERDPF